MGGFSAEVQRGQTSQPAGKGAGMSPSTDRTTMNLGGLSGQPTMGAPNTNANVPLRPINPTFVAPTDGVTNQNPYPNTIGQRMDQTTQTPFGKGGGGGQGGGKGSGGGVVERGGEFNPMSQIENTYHPEVGPQGPKAFY